MYYLASAIIYAINELNLKQNLNFICQSSIISLKTLFKKVIFYS